ncbi:MAG: helix-turn-helix transcriptional regulator [Candidatus Helarchaeota archaeon]|nr:helix-turn-helix transcriptional regulator [Candidatus Helarchaeota archaeon]
MIKRVKEFSSAALITQKRIFLENFESEILRGISTLTVLSIINEYGDEGTYGYQILKDLEEKTGAVLVIEDGTLYPILKKLQREGIIVSEKKRVGGRLRTYYKLTEEGLKIYSHIEGFFTKLIESIASLIDIDVSLKKDRYLYCPNCTNRIDLREKETRFCEVCGLNIEDYKEA